MTTPVWLVLPDPFSARLFFDTGIVDELRKRAGKRLTLVLDADEQHAHWQDRAAGTTIVDLPGLTGGGDGAVRRIDRRLDETVGFYPLSVRQSLRHGFNRTRMQSGHRNWFLDPDRAGRLPQSATLDRLLLAYAEMQIRNGDVPRCGI